MKGKGPNDYKPIMWALPPDVVMKLFKPNPLFETLSQGLVSGGEGVQVPIQEEAAMPPFKPGFQILASSLSGFRVVQVTFANGWMVQFKVPYTVGAYEKCQVGAYDSHGKAFEFEGGNKFKSATAEELVVFLDMIGGK